MLPAAGLELVSTCCAPWNVPPPKVCWWQLPGRMLTVGLPQSGASSCQEFGVSLSSPLEYLCPPLGATTTEGKHIYNTETLVFHLLFLASKSCHYPSFSALLSAEAEAWHGPPSSPANSLELLASHLWTNRLQGSLVLFKCSICLIYDLDPQLWSCVQGYCA